MDQLENGATSSQGWLSPKVGQLAHERDLRLVFSSCMSPLSWAPFARGQPMQPYGGPHDPKAL